MKILVTGGAGFIGSNVVDRYVEAGHDVLVVDDLSSGKRANVHPGAAFFEMDIRSQELDKLMAREKPEIVNHHAAQISVPRSVEDPLLDADVNIKGLLNLLECAVRNGVRKFIFISSGGAVYGEAEQYPTSEAYAPRPQSPYAISKLCSEYYLGFYRHHHGLPFTVLRYANVYGPRQIPHGEAGVVAIFMNNLMNDRPSVLNHFPGQEDGMIRDYCYVGDVATANLQALEAGEGEAVNIGTGRETRTLELYRTIYSAVKEVRPDLDAELADPAKRRARPGDLARSCLVVEKARKALGWEPATDLAAGIRSTLAWWLAQAPGEA